MESHRRAAALSGFNRSRFMAGSILQDKLGDDQGAVDLLEEHIRPSDGRTALKADDGAPGAVLPQVGMQRPGKGAA